MALPYLFTVRLESQAAIDFEIDSAAIGTIVDVYGDGTYEVEFSDSRDGATIALLTFSEDQMQPVALRTLISASRHSD